MPFSKNCWKVSMGCPTLTSPKFTARIVRDPSDRRRHPVGLTIDPRGFGTMCVGPGVRSTTSGVAQTGWAGPEKQK